MNTKNAATSSPNRIEVPSERAAGVAGARKRRHLGVEDAQTEDVEVGEEEVDAGIDSADSEEDKPKTKKARTTRTNPRRAAPRRTTSKVAAAESAGPVASSQVLINVESWVYEVVDGEERTIAVHAYLTQRGILKFKILREDKDELGVSIDNNPVFNSIIFKEGIPDSKISPKKTMDHIRNLLSERKNDEDIEEPSDDAAPAETAGVVNSRPEQEGATATTADNLLTTLSETGADLRTLIRKLQSDNAEKDKKIRNQARQIENQAAELKRLRAQVAQGDGSDATPASALG